MSEYQEGRERWWYYPGRGRSQPSFLQTERTWERSWVRVSAENQSLCASWSADYPKYATSSPASSRFPIWRWHRRCWTPSEGHYGEKIKNGSFASDLRFVHISRYAIKIPGEIVWYGHYRSSSAFKGHNMRCSFEIFLRKGGRNRRLLLASQNCYFLCRRDNFRDRNNAVSINTSFSRYIDMCMKDTDLLSENNVQPILVFQKKLERKAKVESSSANLLLRTTAS